MTALKNIKLGSTVCLTGGAVKQFKSFSRLVAPQSANAIKFTDGTEFVTEQTWLDVVL